MTSSQATLSRDGQSESSSEPFGPSWSPAEWLGLESPLTVDRLYGSPVAATARRTQETASDDGYELWLQRHFPEHTGRPLAEHHHEFWRWVWAIGATKLHGAERPAGGIRSENRGGSGGSTVSGLQVGADAGRPFVAIWPRGGAKSTSAELAVVACAARQTRRYCLYVSGTQDQANDHVLSIRNMFESREFGAAYAQAADRRLGKYGQSQGWQQKRIRTQDGFAVDAIGLDKSVRGLKDESRRPDLIILDDIDALGDSELTTDKKIQAITRDILFTDATEGAAVLAIQNLILPRGVFAKLAEEPPLFLKGRTLSGPVPAVRDLVLDGDRIVSGVPTWKSLEACQADIDGKTLDAWLAECQHEVGLRLKEGLVYGADEDGILRFDPRRNVREAPCNWAQCKWRIVGFDPGGDDPSALVALGASHDDRHHIYRVNRVRGGLDDLAVHEWLSALHREGPISRVVKDAAGGASSIGTLARLGWPILPAEKSRDEIAYVQGLFKNGRLTVDPSCYADVEREIGSYWWDDRIDRTRGSATRWATKTTTDHHADVLDAIRYAVVAVKQGLPGIPTPAGQVGRANGPQFIRPGQGGFVSAGVRR